MTHTDKHASTHATGGADPLVPSFKKLASGLTSVANNTQVTLLADQTITSGTIPLFLAYMEDTPSNDHRYTLDTTTGAPNSAEVRVNVWHKSTGAVDFRVRHADGVARNIRWAAYEVTG